MSVDDFVEEELSDLVKEATAIVQSKNPADRTDGALARLHELREQAEGREPTYIALLIEAFIVARSCGQ